MSVLSALFGRGAVNVAGARGLLDEGAVLVDVRSAREFRGGHAPSARNIPLDQLDRRAATLPAGAPVVVICHSGVRSAQGASILKRHGFDARSVRGGMIAWERAGQRVAR
ncbi:MAG: rhodanese-like domain-containing protein [Actinomycetales bacterium]|nr:rhodanese-like domain-containing protein [Actinomycetales bacterium]